MNLVYENKKSEDEILFLAEKAAKSMEIEKDKSLLIEADNFVGLASLMYCKEVCRKVQLAYFDPPFNTKQTFLVTKNRKNTISRCKTGQVAYEDTMSKDTYLEFLRERLILLKQIMDETGSVLLHTDYKIGHYVKIIMDEIFGEACFKNDISRIKSNPKNFYRKAFGNEKDLVLFYCMNPNKNIWNDVRIAMTEEELKKAFPKTDINGRRYTTIPLHAPGETAGVTGGMWRGMYPPSGRHWRTNPDVFDELDKNGHIEWSSNGIPRIKKYADEHCGKKIQDIWCYKDPQNPLYPTEKNMDMLKMIIQQVTEPNGLVIDFFSGSGSTLKAASDLGRRWIGIDNSDVAIQTIKKRFDNEIDYQYLKL